VTLRALRSFALLAALVLAACSEDDGELGGSGAALDPVARTLAVGESLRLDLRYLRFDVSGLQQIETLQQLRQMPRRVLQDIWLLDLDARPLIVNALEALRDLSGEDVTALSPAARNMRRLLLMTADNAELEGTNLEQLLGLSRAIGIPPARILAGVLGRAITDPLIPIQVAADVVARNVIATHPNVQTRKGPIDEQHPDGVWPVAPGSIPITLADVVTNFEDMATRLGPVGDHPGFVIEANGVGVVEAEFALISKVTANALPFKGVDLSKGEIASVNSIPSQIATVHDFSDPEWLSLAGLVPEPSVERLSFGVVENDAFIRGGTHKEPVPTGDSKGWQLPAWEFERLVLEMARASVAEVPAHCTSYELATGVEVFRACIDDGGWIELTSFNGVGDPPAPAYIWDLELELAQVRLHDGGLAEGGADVAMTVRNVGLGVEPHELIERVRQNLRINPEVLEQLISLITNNSVGAADFYYVRGADSLPAAQRGDWLFFAGPGDIPLDAEGNAARPYAYDRPGFFSDPELRDEISSTDLVDRDTEHEKVRIETGDILYAADDEGRGFRIGVLDKPSRSHVALEVSRVR
jgi:hypothetical protein